MRTIYKRGTLNKRLQKHFPEHQISKNLDLLIYLNYVIYIKRLAEVSSDSASLKPHGPRKRSAISITDQVIRNSMEQVLREFRG